MADLFISYEITLWDFKISQLALSNDEEGLRRAAQDLDAANRLWESWAQLSLGSAISLGSTGRFRVPAEHLDELERLRAEVATAVGGPVSVGVGIKLDEADKALKVAVARGGDTIVLWVPELQEELKASQELSKSFRSAAFRHIKTGEVIDTGPFHDLTQLPNGEQDIPYYEAGFLDDAGHFFNRAQAGAHARQVPQSEMLIHKSLRKADPPPDPTPETTAKENNASAGGGFSGRHEPGTGGTPIPPRPEASEHSQGEAMRALADEISSPEGSGVAADFEDALHDHAQEQDGKDRDKQEKQDGKAEARKKVVEILTQVKQYAPQLEQLKEAAPEIYGAVVGMVEALMLTGRGLLEGGQSDSEKVVDQKGNTSEKSDISTHIEVSKAELEKGWPRTEAENQENSMAQDYFLHGGKNEGGAVEEGSKSTMPLVAHRITGLHPGYNDRQVVDPGVPAPGFPEGRKGPEPKLATKGTTAVGYRRAYDAQQVNERNPNRIGPSPTEGMSYNYGKYSKSPERAVQPQDADSENMQWDSVAEQAMNDAFPLPHFEGPITPLGGGAWSGVGETHFEPKWRLGQDGRKYIAVDAVPNGGYGYGGFGVADSAWLPIGPDGKIDRTETVGQRGSGFHVKDHAAHLPDLLDQWLAANPQAVSNTPPVIKSELAKGEDFSSLSLVDPNGTLHDTGGLSHPDWAHANRHLIGFKGTRNSDHEPEPNEEQATFDEEGSIALDHFLGNGWIRVKPGAGVEVDGLHADNVGTIHKILRGMAKWNPGRSLYVDHHNGTVHVPVSMNGRPDLSVLMSKVQKEEMAAAPAPNMVEGFLQTLKQTPHGAARGQLITRYMNHGPFLQALRAHPQGVKIHQMLTGYLNSPVNAGLGTARATVKAEIDPSKFDPAVLNAATQHEMEHTTDRAVAQQTALDHLIQDPNYYSKLNEVTKEEISSEKPIAEKEEVLAQDELEKAKLPLPENAPTHTHVILPVGATKDGRIKVRHEDGKEGWVSVRAGQVLSNDGHAISSRVPGGK